MCCEGWVLVYIYMCHTCICVCMSSRNVLVFEDSILVMLILLHLSNSRIVLKLLQMWIRFPIHLPVVYLVPSSDIY